MLKYDRKGKADLVFLEIALSSVVIPKHTMSLPGLPTPSSDQLIVVNLAAILVGTTFNAPQKLIKWGGVVIAVVTTTCAIWCNHHL